MKDLPLNMQTFGKIINRNCLYVDKTRNIFNLISQGGQYYFLSRPRRFGKTLLVSTLKEIFSGNKELFKGLWIYDKIQWEVFPVIHIDFLGLKYESQNELIETLEYLIQQNAEKHHIQLKGKGYDKRFKELIMKTAQKNKAVILVDEYDKPIIDFIDTEEKEIALANRKLLKKFYSVLKSADEYIRFVFITGVSKFSRISIFSDLNNLNDITIDDNFSTLLGLTQDELLKYFDGHIKHVCQKMKMPETDLLGHVKQWYNGYSWDGRNFLYNPYSILNFFSKHRFGNYWFSTGTPTFLINYIKNQNRSVTSFENEQVDGSIFETYDIENLEITSMLFQSGYLTIKEIQPVEIVQSRYVLNYPNREVKESFLKHFLTSFTIAGVGNIGNRIFDLVNAVRLNNMEEFFTLIRSLFASIPPHLFIKNREAYYHTVVYLVLKLVGIYIDVEVHTNIGRIDAVIETQSHIYIMEFKMGTPEEAVSQIEERRYHEKYLYSDKSIQLIGVGFNEEDKNISDYKVKPLKE